MQHDIDMTEEEFVFVRPHVLWTANLDRYIDGMRTALLQADDFCFTVEL